VLFLQPTDERDYFAASGAAVDEVDVVSRPLIDGTKLIKQLTPYLQRAHAHNISVRARKQKEGVIDAMLPSSTDKVVVAIDAEVFDSYGQLRVDIDDVILTPFTRWVFSRE
jgi:hypothetical protein